MMKKKLLLKNIPNSRLKCADQTPFQTKMVKIDTLFQTKTAKITIPSGAAHTYIAYIRIYKGEPRPRVPGDLFPEGLDFGAVPPRIKHF